MSMSDELRKKISEANSKRIRAINIETGEVTEYASQTACAKALGIVSPRISRAKMKGGVTGGYRFENISAD